MVSNRQLSLRHEHLLSASQMTEIGAAALQPSAPRATHVSFVVGGLSCGSDAVRLEHRLGRCLGVRDVTVNLVTEAAYIAFDPAMTDRQTLQASIERAGFGARER